MLSTTALVKFPMATDVDILDLTCVLNLVVHINTCYRKFFNFLDLSMYEYSKKVNILEVASQIDFILHIKLEDAKVGW